MNKKYFLVLYKQTVYLLGGVLSPEAHDFSLDESFDSEDDSDHYDDFSSDAGIGFSNNIMIIYNFV